MVKLIPKPGEVSEWSPSICACMPLSRSRNKLCSFERGVYFESAQAQQMPAKKRAENHSDNDLPPYRPVRRYRFHWTRSREGDAEVAPGNGLALHGEVDDRVGNEGNNVV
jgi:hypothetical protein